MIAHGNEQMKIELKLYFTKVGSGLVGFRNTPTTTNKSQIPNPPDEQDDIAASHLSGRSSQENILRQTLHRFSTPARNYQSFSSGNKGTMSRAR
jgi:hypothetical protein